MPPCKGQYFPDGKRWPLRGLADHNFEQELDAFRALKAASFSLDTRGVPFFFMMANKDGSHATSFVLRLIRAFCMSATFNGLFRC